jgi:transposase InsO family protein
MATFMPDKQSTTVVHAFASLWMKHYGAPELLICDQGSEFTGAAFADYCGDAGILVHYTDAASPWQNGRTERAGGLLRDHMKTMFKEMPIESEADLELYLTSALDARNRYIQRSGFSAHQRVFGSAHRLPACLLADDPIDRFLLATNAGAEMQRANAVRAEAQRALFRQIDV